MCSFQSRINFFPSKIIEMTLSNFLTPEFIAWGIPFTASLSILLVVFRIKPGAMLKCC